MNENSAVGPKPEVNVGVPERVLSSLIGASLLTSSFRGGFSLLRALAGGFLMYRGITGNCPGYTLMGKERLPDPVRNINIRLRLLVNRPRKEVYAFWRNLRNLPRFMTHLESVEEHADGTSHWKVKMPAGLGGLEWDAEIVKEVENELLGWNALPNAPIDNAGKVEFFEAGPNQTELHVVISYRAPLGAAGQGLSWLLNPIFARMVREDVMRYKKFMEEGAGAAHPKAGKPIHY